MSTEKSDQYFAQLLADPFGQAEASMIKLMGADKRFSKLFFISMWLPRSELFSILL